MKYRISKLAIVDLENIWVYTYENWSVEQADRYFNLIMDEIEYLAAHPYSGSDYTTVRKGYRRSQIKSHYIFYKVNSKNQQIEIVRILHQRMDVEARFNE